MKKFFIGLFLIPYLIFAGSLKGNHTRFLPQALTPTPTFTTIPGTPCATQIGNQLHGSTTGASNIFYVQASVTGTVLANSINVYMNASGITVIAAIYTDNSNFPIQQIVASLPVVTSGAGFVTLPINPSFVSGAFWIGFCSTTGFAAFTGNTSNFGVQAFTYNGTLPLTANSSSQNGASYAAYITGCSTSATATATITLTPVPTCCVLGMNQDGVTVTGQGNNIYLNEYVFGKNQYPVTALYSFNPNSGPTSFVAGIYGDTGGGSGTIHSFISISSWLFQRQGRMGKSCFFTARYVITRL